jgi:hypothetical protein
MSDRGDRSSSSSKRKRDDKHTSSDKDRHRSSRRDRDREKKRRSRERSREREREKDEKRHKRDESDKKSEANGSKKVIAPPPPVQEVPASTPAAKMEAAPQPAIAPAPAVPVKVEAKPSILPGLNLDALRAMKEKLKQEVQKKSQEQKAPTPSAQQPPAPRAPLVPVAVQDRAAAERMKTVAEIKNQINAKLAALQSRLPSAAGALMSPGGSSTFLPSPISSGGPGPRPLRLDAEGREVDDQGRVVSSGRIPVVATLAINKRVQRESLFKLESPAIETDPTKNPYFDPRMRAPKVHRPHRAFNFVEAGTYVRKGQRMRTKLAKELLESTVGVSEDGAYDDDSVVRDKSLMPIGGLRKEAEEIIQKEDEPVPDVEWWDAPLLVNKERYGPESAAQEEGAMEVVVSEAEKGKEKAGSNLNERRITHLVEHPVALAPPTEKPPPGPMPLKLTKAEQKKMRRRARAEKQREQQERVLLGLEPPPKNRIKISNMMKVLTTEAVQDPTQIEKEVRAEMEERARAHDARNQERKLTPEQKRLKKLKKLKEDTSLITHVALFRVTNLSDVRHKYHTPPPCAVCAGGTC